MWVLCVEYVVVTGPKLGYRGEAESQGFEKTNLVIYHSVSPPVFIGFCYKGDLDTSTSKRSRVNIAPYLVFG